MQITLKIICRGSISILIDGKSTIAQGELTFSPPVFYLDLNSIETWDPPSSGPVSNEEKDEIKKVAESTSINGTKIIVV